ncbi:hypothetical protein Bbelb_078930 [Branchiostoma belcheri]|nr:hypothetical protein Bbelb_078930 [Branchiostoma belcheri]
MGSCGITIECLTQIQEVPGSVPDTTDLVPLRKTLYTTFLTPPRFKMDNREENLPRRVNGHSFPPHHVNSDSDTDSELYQDSVDTPAVPDEMPSLISPSPSSQTPEGLSRNNSFVTQAEIHHDSNGLPSHGALQQTERHDGMDALSSSLPLDSSHLDDSYNNSLSFSPLIRQGRSGDVERRLDLESPAVIGRGGGEMGGQGKGQSGQVGSRRQSGDSTSSGGEQDMNFVLARLSTLEALSTSQARGGIVAPAVQAVQPQQQQRKEEKPLALSLQSPSLTPLRSGIGYPHPAQISMADA